MTISEGFGPLRGATVRCVILGSMPGQASLAQQQYYAHPRNAFWPIMADLIGFEASLPYEQRCRRLTAAGVLLWDVVHQARRPGSLDSAIDTSSIVVNDFTFLHELPQIPVFCNGGKAFQLFQRLVANKLPLSNVSVKLPSTSPAFASMPYKTKAEQWFTAVSATVC